MTTRKKVPWSHWDRFLFIVLGLIFVLVIGLSIWFHELDKNPEVSIPTPTPPAVNAFPYYKVASEAVIDSDKIGVALSPPSDFSGRRLPHRSGYSLGMGRPGMGGMPGMGRPGMGQALNNQPCTYSQPCTFAQKEALVSENMGAIQMLHLGFRYPYQQPRIISFPALYPDGAKIRGLGRLLALQAQVKLKQGDWTGAMTCDLDAIQLGEEIPHGGTLIPMLIGIACQANGRRHAWDIVNHLNSVQAQAAIRRLEQIRADHVSLNIILQEEKWVEQAGLLELMRNRNWPNNLYDVSHVEYIIDVPPWRARLLPIQIQMIGKRRIMANYTRFMNQTITKERHPFVVAAHLPDPPLPNDPVNQLTLSPSLGDCHLRELNAHTQNALLLTMIALHAYQLDHGAYPNTLSALVPHYLKAIPNDPFALSSPLRYKQLGSSYLLYSIGPDGKDDGGRPSFDKTYAPPSVKGGFDRRYWVRQNSQGDIVAGVNTT